MCFMARRQCVIIIGQIFYEFVDQQVLSICCTNYYQIIIQNKLLLWIKSEQLLKRMLT